jgi:transcriptional regulator with XRE-family HTH domain
MQISLSIEVANLSDRIKSARVAKALSQTECARQLGVTRAYWSKWELNRDPTIPIARIREIERLLDVELVPASIEL